VQEKTPGRELDAMREETQMPGVPEPRDEGVGGKSNLTFWQDVKRLAFWRCWANPYWYLLLVLFVYWPIYNRFSIDGLELHWFWWIYAILGPPFWLVMAVACNRTRPVV
jgi:hypothetical protein